MRWCAGCAESTRCREGASKKKKRFRDKTRPNALSDQTIQCFNGFDDFNQLRGTRWQYPGPLISNIIIIPLLKLRKSGWWNNTSMDCFKLNSFRQFPRCVVHDLKMKKNTLSTCNLKRHRTIKQRILCTLLIDFVAHQDLIIILKRIEFSGIFGWKRSTDFRSMLQKMQIRHKTLSKSWWK